MAVILLARLQAAALLQAAVRLQAAARLQVARLLAAHLHRLALPVLLAELVPSSVNGIKTTHVHYVKTKLAVGATRMAKAVSVALLVKARAVAVA